MNLIDTSAWIDYLRGTGSRAAATVHALIEGSGPTASAQSIVCCEPIAMELLAGADRDVVHDRLEIMVNGLPTLRLEPDLDYRSAASIFRAVRRSGRTVRSLNDCLIAAIAIRNDATLVHKDAAFEAIADVTSLRARSLR
ncbi:hypothetical protein CLV56_3825 [Mumia flava]|uniref:Ribonuclease VapC n=1 Tax=Mumia flava TaxID=1348852 RepID=A0A0B2B5B9_9ACTN|nr:PIN domain nuclease [Mumia flava]PJJ54316.1 hypothetical protein CLV56_3825 [Mumia flava]